MTLSESSSQTVTVDYATQPGTAGSEDYQHTSGTLTFDPGQTTQHIVVPVAQDSDGPEHDQTFSVLLTNATNAPIRTVRGTATIPGDLGPVSGAPGRPDGMIRVGWRHFRGENIFNVTGWRQTEAIRARRSHTRWFVVRIRNDSSAPARYVVHGPGSTYGFAIAYRSASYRRVTRAVVRGRYVLTVPARGAGIVRLVVRVRRRAHPGWWRAFLVMAKPVSGTARADAVKAKVAVRR